MNKKMITVFSARYALATGKISEHQATVSQSNHEYVYVVGEYQQQLKLGRDAFPTHNEAVANANDRRLKKVQSLERQIAKLRQVNFT